MFDDTGGVRSHYIPIIYSNNTLQRCVSQLSTQCWPCLPEILYMEVYRSLWISPIIPYPYLYMEVSPRKAIHSTASRAPFSPHRSFQRLVSEVSASWKLNHGFHVAGVRKKKTSWPIGGFFQVVPRVDAIDEIAQGPGTSMNPVKVYQTINLVLTGQKSWSSNIPKKWFCKSKMEASMNLLFRGWTSFGPLLILQRCSCPLPAWRSAEVFTSIPEAGWGLGENLPLVKREGDMNMIELNMQLQDSV